MAHGITRDHRTIGSYRTVGDALVLVVDRSEYDDSLYGAIVSAHCGGHGCTAEAPTVHGSRHYRSMTDPAEQVNETARTVQAWAQAHAETCRATPAPGAHPADTDLPLCGEPNPNDPPLTCQYTAGHTWPKRHAAYPAGYRVRQDWYVESP